MSAMRLPFGYLYEFFYSAPRQTGRSWRHERD